jgi:5-methylcytosine-specific restriction protein A
MPKRAPKFSFRPPVRGAWRRPGKNAHRRVRGRRGVEDRRRILREEPLCRDPFGHHAAAGQTVASEEVDHIRDDLPDDLWDARANKQALCKPCHREKTRREAAAGRV